MMRTSGVFLAVIVFVAGAWGVTRPGDAPEGDEPPAEREVAVAVDATVDPLALPLHLPARLPAGHTWVGETERDHRDGALVAVRTAFQAEDGSVVALCATAASDVGRCGVDADGAGAVVRRVGEYVVWLQPVRGSFPSPAQTRFWETVELTADPTRVPWLPERPA